MTTFSVLSKDNKGMEGDIYINRGAIFVPTGLSPDDDS